MTKEKTSGIYFKVTNEERALIEQKMALAGVRNMSGYIRKMCIDVSRQYTRGCMHERNRHLVDNSSVCVCYLNRESGGTAYTVRYARERGLEIINLAIQ